MRFAVSLASVALVVVGLLAASPALAQRKKDDDADGPVRETIFELPLESETPLPTTETLLQDEPFDWIIFKGDQRGDRLLVTEPLPVRPDGLGVVTARVMEAQRVLLDAQRRDPARVDQRRAELNQARLVLLNLFGDRFGFQYQVDYDEIARIDHHEDIALKRADQERREGNLDQAWELVAHVRRINPDWPRLTETTNRVIFSDAERLLDNGQPERALSVLDQLFDRDPKFLNLAARYGQAVRTLALEAAEAENYRRARYYLSRLQARFPTHEVVTELTRRFRDEAVGIVRAAEQKRQRGDYRVAAEDARRAAKIWADLGAEKRTFERITRTYPILHVGVMRCARESDEPLLVGPSNWRHRRLTRPTLFHLRSVDADLVRYGSDFVQDWTPTDLGRKVVFNLLARQPATQPQPVRSAYDIADDLLRAVDDYGRYGDRYAATLLGVKPTRSDRLELMLGIQPLRVQAFLATIPLGGPGPFEPAPVDDSILMARQATDLVRFTRSAGPEPGTIPGAIAEIVEHQFASGDEMVRGLRRAEVDMLTDVPLYTAVRLINESSTGDETIALPCSLPETHILQFRPGGSLAKVTELRRGLAVSIDREQILSDVFLHDVPSAMARLTTSMMPQFSYAADPTLRPRTPDRFASTALGLVGKRQLPEGEWGPWKMITPVDARSRAAAEQLVDQMRSSGFPVELAELSEQSQIIADNSWEILYRRVQIAEPLIDIWPTLALGEEARLGELTHLPETLRRRILDLEQVEDWNRATDLLRAIDRTLWATAIMIPLWELDRVTLRRKSLREAPQPPLWPYDAIGDWRLEPQIQKSLE